MLGFVVGLLWVTVIAVICLAYLLPNIISKSGRDVATIRLHMQDNHTKTNHIKTTQRVQYGAHNTNTHAHFMGRSEPHQSPILSSASPGIVYHSSLSTSSQTVFWYDYMVNTNKDNLFCSGFPLPRLSTILFLKFFWNVIRVACVVYFVWKNLIFDMQSLIVTDNWKVEDTIALLLILSLFLSSIFVGVLQNKPRMTVYQVGLLLLISCLGCDITVLALTGLNEYWIVFGLAFAPLIETIFFIIIVFLANSIFNAHWAQYGSSRLSSRAPDCYYIIETNSDHNETV
ncbi:MAG: hypothetical protein BWY22_02513 [Bacteroidetes bacterium ADurb.Bin217]|nr:MAG: hypothetical protein BWY22_02513 [Bacteroidetes bacterium ADurb.Bin217]